MRTIQIEGGKWYRMNNPETSVCCDCNLAHVTWYRMTGDGKELKLEFKARRNNVLTAHYRKKHGIRVICANKSI